MIIDENGLKTMINKNDEIKNGLKSVIDEVIEYVDFKKYKSYKYEFNQDNGFNGVFFNIYNKWIWSWMNAINTNYSCLFLLVDYINKNFERKITILDFSSNRLQNTLSYFKDCLMRDKQIIFTPGSYIFKEMFFKSQYTWTWGIISQLSSIFTIKKNYNIEHIELNYERGVKSDMTKGMDMEIFYNGKNNITQHKLCNIELNNDYYISNNFNYNESTYRNNLDLISIEHKKEIYLFHNSKDHELCGRNSSGFFIHKNLLISKMKIEKQEITNSLIELNQICCNKKIIFGIEKGENGKNYFEEVLVNGNPSIRFFLNDIHDLNLENLIKEQVNKLK